MKRRFSLTAGWLSSAARAQIVRGTCVAGWAVMMVSAAQAAGPEGGAMSACSVDLAAYCRGVEAGGGKKMQCLTDNQSKLSADCATSIDARRAQRAARRGETQLAQAPAATPSTGTPPVSANTPAAAAPAAGAAVPQPMRVNLRACRADIATFCLGFEKGGGRRIACLMENQAKLTPDCAAAVALGQQKREVARQVCRGNAKALCPKLHGLDRLSCLQANKARLTPDCAAVVDQRLTKQTQRDGAPPQSGALPSKP